MTKVGLYNSTACIAYRQMLPTLDNSSVLHLFGFCQWLIAIKVNYRISWNFNASSVFHGWQWTAKVKHAKVSAHAQIWNMWKHYCRLQLQKVNVQNISLIQKLNATEQILLCEHFRKYGNGKIYPLNIKLRQLEGKEQVHISNCTTLAY